MEVGGETGADMQAGGGSTRRRRQRRRRTQKGSDAEIERDTAVAVDKVDGAAPAPAAPPASSVKKPVIAAPPAAAAAPAPKVVIAPPKKKPAKVMLVPKKAHVVARPQKTFKAKRVHVTIDNTATTRKKRRMTLARVEAMTEEQLRETAVATKLSRIETVKKVPADLLRQMLKDYYTMRGMLL